MDDHGVAALQPLLHESVVALRAPAQFWSAPDGSVGGTGSARGAGAAGGAVGAATIQGGYLGDTRILRGLSLTIGGRPGEHLSTTQPDASTLEFDALFRALQGSVNADPDVRGRLTRTVRADGVSHRFRLTSRLGAAVESELRVELLADLTRMPSIKSGVVAEPGPAVLAIRSGARWSDESVTAELDAPGATVSVGGATIILTWQLEVPAHGSVAVDFLLTARDGAGVVSAPTEPAPWGAPQLVGVDDRLARWVARAVDDLDALRLVSDWAPGEQFLAAGAPWFFTLFGRDSLWAARLLLPLGSGLAASTLRVLASMQGTASIVDTAEQPGKIMHELRRSAQHFAEGGSALELPPLYYGTVDATPLWICVLADAAEAGMPEDEVRALLPNLEAALAWMRDFGDSDGDGLLEYVDESGRGLTNQGWKDSGDSVQWRDGTLAEGPIALCEVQAYAYQAAMRGADLLERFGTGDPAAWRAWAARLATAFREQFWISDPSGAYPAIALDAHKHPIDTVTSNIGHLLGTGLLHPDEAALVARRLVSPELASGFGLRTMSTDSSGYWPLSYHGGSVWAHDTAIAIAGLSADGFADEAAELSEGLLRAAVAFDYRMPELHSGDALAGGPVPAPYPAACRPQAWSAAAAITVLTALR
ncbi:glycogen debranching N-terminal domain-containing protein [soil metagenome]